MINKMKADPLSTTFAALADPTRRAILEKLTRGAKSVNELAAPFQMTLPAISKHLRGLAGGGLIERSRHAQWRPCKLRVRPLKKALGWISRYRQFWEEGLDRLDLYLRDVRPGKDSEAE